VLTYQKQNSNQFILDFVDVESLAGEIVMFVGQYMMMPHTAEIIVHIRADLLTSQNCCTFLRRYHLFVVRIESN
jgi:hypothetical protein